MHAVPRHTELELFSSRRLMQQTGLLPTCEIDLAYTVTAARPDAFDTSLTITNNRELASNWQLMYTYADYQSIRLANTSGATVLSNGSVTGAPVRLVDTFQFGSNGIAAGANDTFTTTSAFISGAAAGNDSLLITGVNVNGLQCSQLLPQQGDTLSFKGCSTALSLFSPQGGSAGNTPTAACSAAFCCGYILSDPSAVASPSPSPLPPVIVPTPSPGTNQAPAPPSNLDQQPVPVPAPQPGSGSNNESNSSNGDTQGRGGLQHVSGTTALIAAIAVVAAVLVFAVLLTACWIRRQRKRHAAQRAVPVKQVPMPPDALARGSRAGRSSLGGTTKSAQSLARSQGSTSISGASQGSRGAFTLPHLTSVSPVSRDRRLRSSPRLSHASMLSTCFAPLSA